MSCRQIASSSLRRATRASGSSARQYHEVALINRVEASHKIAQRSILSPAKQQSRSLATSSTSHSTVVVTTPTSAPAAVFSPSSASRGLEKAADERKNTISQARHLLTWQWFPSDSEEHRQLDSLLVQGATGADSLESPEWLSGTFALAKSYRQARSRLWRPTQEQLRAHVQKDVDAEEWVESKLRQRKLSGPQELESALDGLFKPVWQGMSPDARSDALSRVKFDCARRLGWRKGYSSGYPLTSPEAVGQDLAEIQAQLQETEKRLAAGEQGETGSSPDAQQFSYRQALEERKQALLSRQSALQGWAETIGQRNGLLQDMLTNPDPNATDKSNQAYSELMQREEEDALKEWMAMTLGDRNAEFKAAWRARDRSHVYIDDSPSSTILSAPLIRWYATPQRAGQLQFLPNYIVRLVKNHTPAGQQYDPWKATFRVPLQMHKHMMRSYLLSIYGLRTTWARSSIYRSPVIRNNRTGRKEVGNGKTYKKVEVGLLEPFIWPDVDPKFKTDRLLSEDMEFEKQRMYIRMTKGRRWRAVRPVDRPVGSSDDQAPLIMARAKGIPTAKHSRILALLRSKQVVKEETIRQKAKELAAQPVPGQRNAASL